MVIKHLMTLMFRFWLIGLTEYSISRINLQAYQMDQNQNQYRYNIGTTHVLFSLMTETRQRFYLCVKLYNLKFLLK